MLKTYEFFSRQLLSYTSQETRKILAVELRNSTAAIV